MSGWWGDAIPRRIAFINEKGGSGKTTLTANVGAYLALRRGRRVLAVDVDPQGQLGKVLGLDVRRSTRTSLDLLLDAVLGVPEGAESLDAPRPAGFPAQRTRIPNLDVVVANKSLALFPAWTGRATDAEEDPTGKLAASLARWPEVDRYDFVLFDAPPSFGPLTLNVLRAAEDLVVPVPLTFLALDGCAELMRTLELVRERYGHPRLRVTMVIPNFHRRTRMAAEVLERLKQRFRKEIAHSVLGFQVKLDEAQSHGLSIFEYAPRSSAAAALAALAEELELRAAERPAREGLS
jgi:chromosome partitioning protein